MPPARWCKVIWSVRCERGATWENDVQSIQIIFPIGIYQLASTEVVLMDVADAVADELELSTEQISLEMLFRGFYHFNHAYSCGKASDHIAYFTARENQDLRIVKYEHKSRIRQQLNLSAYPT